MKKVALGMSGGVDSSVSALLLKEAGYEVTGVYLQMLEKDKSQAASEDARQVAEKLGIDFLVFDVRKEFKEKVIDYFTDSYLKGLTPNPCVVCNREIKFKLFFDLVKDLDIQYLASGHYVDLYHDPQKNAYYLKQARDLSKDQSYFLYYLNQASLSKTIFPLASYTKEEVKELALKADLHLARKKDSQEICFISDNDYKKFLLESIGQKAFAKGPVYNMQGELLGQHQGLPFYTIGQRKGLGLSLKEPAYVVSKNLEGNALYLGQDKDLYSGGLLADELNLVDGSLLDENIIYDVKIRYSLKTAQARVKHLSKDKIEVYFLENQRAISPGQSIVIYKDNILLAGGVILKSL